MPHLVFDLETKPFLGKRAREDFEIACAVGYEPSRDRWRVWVEERAYEETVRNASPAAETWGSLHSLADLADIPWERAVVVGHSVWHNDLPILHHNLRRRKIEFPDEVTIIDTQRALERAGGGCVGLDRLGLANFGAARDESGRAASLAWARGDFGVTIDHCRRDVKLTYDIWECLREGDIRLPDEKRIPVHPEVLVPEVWRLPEKKKSRRREDQDSPRTASADARE